MDLLSVPQSWHGKCCPVGHHAVDPYSVEWAFCGHTAQQGGRRTAVQFFLQQLGLGSNLALRPSIHASFAFNQYYQAIGPGIVELYRCSVVCKL